jgi:hypothetical protein
MDRLTRTSIIISGLLLILLVVSLTLNRYGARPRVWELNEMLRQDPVLATYPYEFRVVLFLNGVATLTSPHGNELPIEPFLKVVAPALAGQASDAVALAAAEEQFRQHEMRAIELLTAEQDVTSVVWALDRAWYHDHHIPLAQP